MKAWLVGCTYEIYCQGTEEEYGTFLVYADTFDEATDRLYGRLQNPKDFINLTIE